MPLARAAAQAAAPRSLARAGGRTYLRGRSVVQRRSPAEAGRGDAAAATWILYGGDDAAAATWIFYGGDDAAATTWIFRSAA